MNKQALFASLAKEVSECHLCENMLVKPHCTNSELLENDDHGLRSDTPYVNFWNRWHGNLDADIMVIGQDYGQKEDNDFFLTMWKAGTYKNHTDCALRDLFESTFGINIDQKDVPLFFTNAANCYRKQKTTGGMHSGWLPICVNKFMARLICIVRPKVIIVLGRAAFEAMFCMDGLTVECCDPQKSSVASFASIMQHTYQIRAEDMTIRVFPVYHPGANSNINRPIEQQKEDWKHIAQYYDSVKSR